MIEPESGHCLFTFLRCVDLKKQENISLLMVILFIQGCHDPKQTFKTVIE